MERGSVLNSGCILDKVSYSIVCRGTGILKFIESVFVIPNFVLFFSTFRVQEESLERYVYQEQLK